MAGIGLRAHDRASIYFRVVAWDSEYWNRVFAIAPVRDDRVERLRITLNAIETAREPFWLPGPATDTPRVNSAWDEVFADASESRNWTLAESHDLLDAVNEIAVPAEFTSDVVRRVQQRAVADISAIPLVPRFLDQLAEARP
jgi:hypothetical protein